MRWWIGGVVMDCLVLVEYLECAFEIPFIHMYRIERLQCVHDLKYVSVS